MTAKAPPPARAFPLVPCLLGLAGLIPFLAGAGSLLLGLSLPAIGGVAQIRLALVVYAIAILSFLGGVRWGIALGYDDSTKATRDYIIAVIPVLVGWMAIGLAAPRDLWLLCAAFVILGLLDYGLACRTVAPEWYGNLRLLLSGVAALCLGIAALS
jgi:Protein of unknown function (DUF3429)